MLQQEFIKCLQAYLKGEKLNKIEDDKDLVNLALEQSLQTILYPVYNDKSYKKYYIGWVVKQEEFLSIQNEITNIFNDNNINHLYFKGSVLCNLYDDPSIRTRGDIDVYVDINDLDKARNLLINNNFKFEDIDNMHHISFWKNNLEVELHFAMVDDSWDKKIQKYLENPFAISIKKEFNLYELNPANHFIYCMCHYGHHLRYGAGVRYILDFYYMFLKTNINYDELHKNLKLLNLEILYNNILNYIYYLTGKEFDSFEKMDIDWYIEYSLKYGIHGHENDEVDMQSVAHKSKYKFLISRTFLTNKLYRQAKYPVLGKHWYLMPLCLLRHWCFLLTHKLGGFFKLVLKKNHRKELFDKLGI